MSEKYKFEIYTSTDKAKRDELFQALRKSDDPFERQVVKFSGWEPVIGEDGHEGHFVWYDESRRNKLHPPQRRMHYRSTWSVAHPKAENF